MSIYTPKPVSKKPAWPQLWRARKHHAEQLAAYRMWVDHMRMLGERIAETARMASVAQSEQVSIDSSARPEASKKLH